MFKSFINPEKIIGNGTQAVSPEVFSNFMLGGQTLLGSSVVKTSEGNVSNFSRSGVSVDTSSSIAPLIQKISTKIVNNVDNSINNTLNSFKTEIQTLISGVQKQVQSNLSSLLDRFSNDYQQRMQSKEDNKPSNILNEFLGLYKNAIDFVSFFGDNKNIKKIEINLKSLRTMFNESFDTAIVIRQVINKIVKQLSNLPTASGNSGALNLDVTVPGGRLKQTGAVTIGKALKGRGGPMLGVGVAGAAGLGLMGMQAAKASQEQKLEETAKKPEDEDKESNKFIEGLNNIIEKFSDVIENLLGVKKEDTPGGGGGSTSSGESGGEGSPGGNTAGLYDENMPTEPGSFNTAGNLIASGVEASYYDPSLGGINASGAKTSTGEPATSTGEPYRRNVFSAAAFPSLLSKLPESMTTRSKNNPSGRTLSSGQAFNVLVVDPKTNKSAIVRINDVGSGVSGQPNNRMLDLSVAAKNYFGQNVRGLQIFTVDSNSTPGPIPQNSPILSNINKPQNIQPQKPTPTAVIPQSTTQPRIEPAPPNPKAQEVSRAITTPPGQSSNSQTKIINMPTEVATIPIGNNQSGGEVIPPSPSGGESDAPDVSMFGRTSNEHNPYWFTPYKISILTA